MEPSPQTMLMFGQPSGLEALPWAWVDEQLSTAGTYWVVPRGGGHPHPRPVWGVWLDGSVRLSLGSPVNRRLLDEDPTVTVHLDSSTDVVVVEGTVTGTDGDAATIAAYDQKYDWVYDLDRYGPFTVVRPTTILSWRAVVGPAGHDGFKQGSRWTF